MVERIEPIVAVETGSLGKVDVDRLHAAAVPALALVFERCADTLGELASLAACAHDALCWVRARR
jgi:hypothetical protein